MSEKRFIACDKWADSKGNIFKFVVIDTKILGDKQFVLRCSHWSQAQDICNRLNDTLDELREENEQLKYINNPIDEEEMTNMEWTNIEFLLLLIPFILLFILLTMYIIAFLVQLGWVVI